MGSIEASWEGSSRYASSNVGGGLLGMEGSGFVRKGLLPGTGDELREELGESW